MSEVPLKESNPESVSMPDTMPAKHRSLGMARREKREGGRKREKKSQLAILDLVICPQMIDNPCNKEVDKYRGTSLIRNRDSKNAHLVSQAYETRASL
jgi:hypothetical protein